jgi:predicted nucleic acid-binding protein
LPAPHRAPAGHVRAFLQAAFPGPWLALSGQELASLLGRMVELGITGGATYDGLIGTTAKSAGATLFTCDRRARSIYERLGVEVRYIG